MAELNTLDDHNRGLDSALYMQYGWKPWLARVSTRTPAIAQGDRKGSLKGC